MPNGLRTVYQAATYQAVEWHKLLPVDPSVLRGLHDISITTAAAAHTVAGLMHRSCSCTHTNPVCGPS